MSVPIRSSPANLGIRAGGSVDLGLAVDSEVALLVQLQQLVLDGPRLPVEAFHLTPWQHTQLACGNIAQFWVHSREGLCW